LVAKSFPAVSRLELVKQMMKEKSSSIRVQIKTSANWHYECRFRVYVSPNEKIELSYTCSEHPIPEYCAPVTIG